VKLSACDLAQLATVSQVADGPYATRLASFGIRPGAQIQIIGKTTGSGLILKVEENRVAIHKSMAQEIDIELSVVTHV